LVTLRFQLWLSTTIGRPTKGVSFLFVIALLRFSQLRRLSELWVHQLVRSLTALHGSVALPYLRILVSLRSFIQLSCHTAFNGLAHHTCISIVYSLPVTGTANWVGIGA
jgi:hypothetical protein